MSRHSNKKLFNTIRVFWKIQSSQILFANEYFRLNNFSWQLRSIFKWLQWLNCTWARIQAETINKGLHKVIFASKKYLQSTQEFNLQERQLFQIGFMINWFVIMIWKSSFWELEQMWAISKGIFLSYSSITTLSMIFSCVTGNSIFN